MANFTMEGIVAAIRDNDTDLFIERLLEELNTCRSLDDKWFFIDESLCLCTIYNRPKMMAKCEIVTDTVPTPPSNHFDLGERNLGLAEIMDYKDCLKELEKLYPQTHNEYTPFQLAKSIIYLDNRYGKDYIDIDVFKGSIKKVLGSYINTLDTSGKTFLHEMIHYDELSFEKLSALLEIGCDINMLDSEGHTPFFVFCRSHHSTLGFPYFEPLSADLARKLPLLIMENPSASLSDSADHDILWYELVKFKEKHDYRDPSDAELLSFPLATLLYKHGFQFLRNAKEDGLLHQFRLVHGVQKLSEHCRIVLRQHYTGKAIHTFVQGDNVPKHLRDYILLKDIIHL